MLAVAPFGVGSASADDAKDLLKKMSDYLAAQKSFSFSYQSSMESVTKDFQKLQFVSSGTASVARPDKLRITRTGGFVDAELIYDGSTLTVHGKNLDSYAQIEAKGTIDELSGHLAEAGIEPPGADLLSSNVFDILMEEVIDAKHIATAVVDGTPCEYLAFRTNEVDWQIWIQIGDKPIPRRYVITSKYVVAAPEYTLQITDWKDGDAVAAADFTFKPDTKAKKVDLSQIEMIDELPSQSE
jgi:hypothetical protein